MSQLRVEPTQLGAMAAEVSDAQTAIQDHVSTVHTGMNDLAQSWTGEAHSAFAARFADWEADMQTSSRLLAAMGAAVTAAQKRYLETDEAVGKMWTW